MKKYKTGIMFYRKSDYPPDLEDSLVMQPSDEVIAELCQDKLGEKPLSCKYTGQGTFHYIYELTLPDKECILKIAKYQHFQNQLTLEHHLYERLLKKFIFSCSVLAFDESYKTYPFVYLVLSKAKGTSLRDLNFDNKSFEPIIQELGRVIAVFHQWQSPKGYGHVNMAQLLQEGKLEGIHRTWSDYLSVNLNNHLKFILTHKIIVANEMNVISNFFEEKRHMIDSIASGTLLHGDLGSHNIFINKPMHKITAIIDWEDTLLGDPIFDLANFASFYRMHEYMGPLLAGYRSLSKLEDNDLGFKFWLYYLRIVLAKCVLRIKLGYDKPGESKTREKLKLAINGLIQQKAIE